MNTNKTHSGLSQALLQTSLGKNDKEYLILCYNQPYRIQTHRTQKNVPSVDTRIVKHPLPLGEGTLFTPYGSPDQFRNVLAKQM